MIDNVTASTLENGPDFEQEFHVWLKSQLEYLQKFILDNETLVSSIVPRMTNTTVLVEKNGPASHLMTISDSLDFYN